MNRHLSNYHRRGQSLMELLLGMALGAIFIVGTATIIVPSLQSNKTVASVQAEAQLANELMNNIDAWSAASWPGVLAVATGSGHPYFINASSSPFSATSGSETTTITSAIYSRSFYLTDIYRDSYGNATTSPTGNLYDISTKMVTVSVSPTSSSYTSAFVISSFISRTGSNDFYQSSWAGGGGFGTSATFVTSTYSSSSNMVVNADGSIQLSGGGGAACTL